LKKEDGADGGCKQKQRVISLPLCFLLRFFLFMFNLPVNLICVSVCQKWGRKLLGDSMQLAKAAVRESTTHGKLLQLSAPVVPKTAKQ